MNPPFDSVTVIIPAFNRADTLPDAIESALRQTHTPLEIIVIDDGSSDQTPELGVERLHPSVRYHRLETNTGAPCARNVATRMARGHWLAHLDADDLWLPHKLASQLHAVRNASASFCASNLIARTGSGNDRVWNDHLPPGNVEGLCNFLMVEGGSLQTSTLMVRHDIARSHPFSEDLKKHQDWDLVLRLAATGLPWTYVPEPLSIYVMDNNPKRISISRPNVYFTLDWFRDSPHVTREAAAYFFARHCLGRAGRQLGTGCANVLFNLASRSPRAAWWALRGIKDLAVSRTRRLMHQAA